MTFAVDENVIAVANDARRAIDGHPRSTPQASDECLLAAVEFLGNLQNDGITRIDAGDVVFRYYQRKASLSGRPGVGDAFLYFLYQNQYNANRVLRFDLTDGPDYSLPEPIASSGFDLDDRIYLALALAAPHGVVVNAVDSDYAQYTVEIAAIGVSVRQLC